MRDVEELQLNTGVQIRRDAGRCYCRIAKKEMAAEQRPPEARKQQTSGFATPEYPKCRRKASTTCRQTSRETLMILTRKRVPPLQTRP